MKRLTVVIAIAATLVGFEGVTAQTPSSARKNIAIVIASGTGGGLDLWGRTIARHIGKYLPGNPTVVPRNMPGAGGAVAANYIYNIGPKDGTLIGIVPGTVFLGPLTGATNARFDAVKFTWIGTPTMYTNVCIAMATAKVKTFNDLLIHELIVGTTGAASGGNIYPKALNGLMGTKFKLISGFGHASNVLLAMERKEVDGVCQPLETIVSLRPDWIPLKKVKVLFQGGAQSNGKIKSPFITDLARSEEQKLAIEFLYAGNKLGRPLVAPPGMAAGNVKMLRAAFEATMKDPQFLADAERQKLDVLPENGEYLAVQIRNIYATPKMIVNKVTGLIK